jgi:RNA polymerase sigma-70 factor (ECF subfamily)
MLPTNTTPDSSTPIEHLARRAREKDTRALEELLRICRPGLVRHASRLIRDRDAVQDVVQETLLRLHANIGQLLEPAAFWVWAKTILHREAIDYFHKEKRYVHDAVELRDAGQELEYDQLEASRLTQKEMDWYLRRLPNADRDLLGLFYWREYEIKEIAAMLGVAVGAAKVRLFRARSRLREMLAESEAELYSH